jgi:hypothetical protein
VSFQPDTSKLKQLKKLVAAQTNGENYSKTHQWEPSQEGPQSLNGNEIILSHVE